MDPTKTIPDKYEEKVITPRFGRFVTRNDQYYTHVNLTRSKIRTYIKKHRPKRPLNVLLAAPPGSGKSFLIKQIIAAIELENIKELSNGAFVGASIEEIYISALDNADELFAMFQRVQSVNLEYKIPVVFFDEIDSDVNGFKVYAKLLAPMWDGQFYIGKEKFLLGPAIFFFAGSGLSCEDQSQRILGSLGSNDMISYNNYNDQWKEAFKKHVASGKRDKLPDFVDRIDSVLRIPPISEKLLGDQTKAEVEDIVCMLIKKHFDDAEHIGKLLLEKLTRKLLAPNAIREVEKLIFCSDPPLDNHFDIFRLPSNERDESEHGLAIRFEPAYWSVKIG